MTLVLVAFFVLLLLGLPIGYVLGVAGVLGLMQLGGTQFLAMAPQRFFEGLDLFTFMAMPFFILAGVSMERISRAALPFILALIAPLMIVTYIPRLSRRLPRLFGLR